MWNETDEKLDSLLSEKKLKVREALCDNFATPKAVQELFELVTATNGYLQQDPKSIKVPLVRAVSKYIFHVLKCFGIYEDGDYPTVSGDGAFEDVIAPLMNALAKFRDDIKNPANNSDQKTMFKLCDELRDDILPFLGIRLEDKGKDAPSIWKYEEPGKLIKEREVKIAEKAKKDAEKAKKEAEKKAKAELDLKKKSTSGKEWFKTFEAEKYSEFDEETGLPSKKADGKPLNDNELKNLMKLQKKQEEKYQKWLKT